MAVRSNRYGAGNGVYCMRWMAFYECAVMSAERVTDEMVNALRLFVEAERGHDWRGLHETCIERIAIDHADAALSAADAVRASEVKPILMVTENGYMDRKLLWLEGSGDLPDGRHLLYLHPPHPDAVRSKEQKKNSPRHALGLDAYYRPFDCAEQAADAVQGSASGAVEALENATRNPSIHPLTHFGDVITTAYALREKDWIALQQAIAALRQPVTESKCKRCGANDWETTSTTGGNMDRCTKCGNCRWHRPVTGSEGDSHE